MSAARQILKTEFEQSLLVTIWTGIGLVFLIPLIVSTDPLPDTLFPFIVGKALFGRVVIEIIFGLWLVLAFRYPAYRVPRSWLLLVFGIYLGVSVLAGLFGVSIQLSLWSTYERMQGIVDLAHWFAFTLVLTSMARSWLSWRALLNVNLAISLLVAFLGLAQHYGFGDSVPIYRPGGQSILATGTRLDITLGNATYVGAYMLVNVFIGLGLLARSFGQEPRAKVSAAIERRRRRRLRADADEIDLELWGFRLFWFTVVALDFWALVFSGTRGASIGFAAGLLVFTGGYILWGRLRAIKVIAGTLVLVVVVLALIVGLARNTSFIETISDSNVMVRRLVNMRLDESNVKSRFTTWRTGLEAFAARPILGWGPENFLIGWGLYFDDDPEIPETFDQAHNKLVEELTTKGILGFGSYIAIWALMAAVVVQRVRTESAREQLFTLFIGAALTGYFVQNLFLFDTPGTVLMFFLLLALVVNLETGKERYTPGPATGPKETRSEAGVRPWHRLMARLSADGSRVSGLVGVRWLDSTGLLRSQTAPWVALVAVLVLVGLGIWSINYRPYSAATAYSDAEFSPTWEGRFKGHQRSIDNFPPLANQARMFLFSRIAVGLEGMTESEVRTAMTMVEREAQAAFENEPRGWRIYSMVASVYQRASLRDPEFLEVARSYVDRAEELAPGTVEVFVIKTQQEILEQQ